jgi:hypothetical protein
MSLLSYGEMIGFMSTHPNVDLNFWKKHLGHVPDEVWYVADELETLVLADNDLVELPDRIGTLTRLRMLGPWP